MKKEILLLLIALNYNLMHSQNLTSNQSITISGPLIAGTETTFSTSIINNGSVNVGTFANHFYIDINGDGYNASSDVVLGKRENFLNANNSINFTKKWTAIQGTHKIRVLTDGLNEVNEVIETDNSSEWISFTVLPERNFGVYGRGWQDYLHNVDSNFKSIIYQYAHSTNISDTDRVDEIYNLLNSGNEVIINLYLSNNALSTPENKVYFTLDQFLSRAKLILKDARIQELNRSLSFTLGEENHIGTSIRNPTIINGLQIFDYLELLYVELNKLFPNHKFKQWYSPRCRLVHQFSGEIGYNSRVTPYIRNDGWVYDHYNFGNNSYNFISDLYANDAIRSHNITSSLIWLSPDWIILTSDDIDCTSINNSVSSYSQSNWWNIIGWKIFYNNLAKNIERNIPTYFYMYTKNTLNGSTKPLFSNHAKQCHHDFVNFINNVTIPYLKTHNIPLSVPTVKPNWIPDFNFDNCDNGKSTRISTNKNKTIIEDITFNNPIKDILYLKSKEKINKITIYSINGSRIKKIENLSNYDINYNINLNGINRGLYILQVKTNSNIYFKKIIKD